MSIKIDRRLIGARGIGGHPLTAIRRMHWQYTPDPMARMQRNHAVQAITTEPLASSPTRSTHPTPAGFFISSPSDGRAIHDIDGKQARFVEEYLCDLNATQAAIHAGYSERTAKNIGYEQLQKPEVVEAIAAAQAARSERTRIDADWVLKRLVEETEADLADLYGESGMMKAVRDCPVIWRKGLAGSVSTPLTMSFDNEIRVAVPWAIRPPNDATFVMS